jgi:hypothetical protein
MPGEVLAYGVDAAGRRVVPDHALDVGAGEVGRRNGRAGMAAGAREIARPAHLCDGRVRDKLGPHRLDDVEAAHVVEVVGGEIAPRQGAVVAKQRLEGGAAPLKDRIAENLRVDEVKVTIGDRQRAEIHGRLGNYRRSTSLCPAIDVDISKESGTILALSPAVEPE